MSTEKFQKIVDGYVEAFENADLEIIRNMFADNATVEDPVGTEAKVGKEAILAFYTQAFEAGAKLKRTEPIRVAGNSVAFSFDVLMGDMKISPIDVFELNADGQVQSMRAYWGPENMG